MPAMHDSCELPSRTHNPFHYFHIRPELFQFCSRHQLALPIPPLQLTLTSPPPPGIPHLLLKQPSTPCAFPSSQASFPSSFLPLKEISYVHLLLQIKVRLNPTKGMMPTVKRKNEKKLHLSTIISSTPYNDKLTTILQPMYPQPTWLLVLCE